MTFAIELQRGSLWIKAGAFALHWVNYSREEIPRRAWRVRRYGVQLGRAVVLWEYAPQASGSRA